MAVMRWELPFKTRKEVVKGIGEKGETEILVLAEGKVGLGGKAILCQEYYASTETFSTSKFFFFGLGIIRFLSFKTSK